MRNRRTIWIIGLALALLGGTAAADPVDDTALLADQPPKLLSEYRLFIDGPAQKPSDRVVPYDLNTPLFSDYAAKFRFVYVPGGKAAAYHPNEVFDFPVGTVLVKTFAYPADFRAPEQNIRLIETRLLIHKPSGWVALPYVWNADMTDAVLKKAGARLPVSWTGDTGTERSIRYVVPNINQCKGCHIHNGTMTPIGPKARNLNKDYPYPDGAANQLAHWTDIGTLDGAPAPSDAPRVPRWDDDTDGTLETRARAYLDVNCGHCHRPGGPGDTSGLFLDFNETDPTAYGVLKRPVAAGRGSGGLDFDIAPGDPDASILLFRMLSLDPGIMMPELGRATVHAEGVALIRRFIAAMPQD